MSGAHPLFNHILNIFFRTLQGKNMEFITAASDTEAMFSDRVFNRMCQNTNGKIALLMAVGIVYFL